MEERPAGGWRPPLDLVETADAFVLYAELPGVRREDLTLETDGRSLKLSGIRRPQGDARGFLRLEGCYGRFRRRLELPEPVADDAVEARLRRGILEVVLPKRARRASGTRVPVREE